MKPHYLKEQFERFGVKQTQISEKLNLTPARIKQILQGRGAPKPEIERGMLLLLADVVDHTEQDL